MESSSTSLTFVDNTRTNTDESRISSIIESTRNVDVLSNSNLNGGTTVIIAVSIVPLIIILVIVLVVILSVIILKCKRSKTASSNKAFLNPIYGGIIIIIV